MIPKPPPPPPTPAQCPPDRVEPKLHQVLWPAGYPCDCLVLDFEAFFSTDYSLKDLTTPEYIADPRFEVLCLAYLSADAEKPEEQGAYGVVVGEYDVALFLRDLQRRHGEDLGKLTIIMQNAEFDASVLAYRYDIHPKNIIDTLNLARAWHTRSKHDLGHLAKQFGLPAKGNTADFKDCTLRKRMVKAKGRKPKPPVQLPRMTPEQVTALCEYASNDVVLEWGVFCKLLPKLSNPYTELRIMDHTLRLFTQPCLTVDYDHGTKLIEGMRSTVAELITKAGVQDVAEITGDKSFDLLLNERFYAIGEDIRWAYKFCKNGVMLALAQDDPQRKLLLNHHDDVVRALCAARTGLDSWAAHIGRVERIMRMAKVCGDLLPVPLKYHGAHTGRASGGQKINLQNLPRQGHPLVVGMKGLIAARPRTSLVIVDLAAIEARVLAWAAGQQDLCELFAAGKDVYSDMASDISGTKIRKARETDPEPLAAKYTQWRQRGKIVVLGCGYGMGATHFTEYAASQGVIVDEEEAKRYIKTYRDKNPYIVGFWGTIERAFRYVAQYKRPCALPQGLRFYSRPDCDVVIVLPNGRELHYHKVRVDDRELSVFNDLQHSWDYLWGGVLTENVVQAISRDVMIEAGLRMEDHGYHVAHHVHDELILNVTTEDAPKVLALTVKELSRVPEWAPGLPLNAEGKIRQKYGAH